MKKSLKYTGVALGVAALFTTGTVVGATTDWKTGVINSAYSGFLDVASSKTNELTNDVDGDINKKVQNEIKGSVEENEAELQKLLDQYYQLKLEGFANTEEYRALEKQITDIRQNVYESYKKRIDDAFAGK